MSGAQHLGHLHVLGEAGSEPPEVVGNHQTQQSMTAQVGEVRLREGGAFVIAGGSLRQPGSQTTGDLEGCHRFLAVP